MRQFVSSESWHRVVGALCACLCSAGALLPALLVAAAWGAPLRAQTTTVAGTVVEVRSGRPLSGVQITVSGQGRGTVTDANGRFRIDDLRGQEVTLEVLMLGYRTETVSAPVGTMSLRITLSETAVELDEVIVTGTAAGTERKRQIGNSVSQVNAAAVTEVAPIQNMQQLLNGRATGVFVAPSTGQVGGGQRIRVRGQTTFSLLADPLIYVDGVRVNNEVNTGISMQGFSSGAVSRMNDINPEDIETIEILKGPAAATLYGTEASRGVVNIITKKGAPGGARYSFTTRQGASWFHDPSGRLPTNYWRPAPGQPIQALDLYEREEQRGNPLFRTGRLQGYNLSVAGGNEGVRYFVSGDWDDDEGIDPTNARTQLSARANVQVQPSDKFDLSISTGYVNNETDIACEAGCGGRMWGVLFSSPSLLPENCAPDADFGCGISRGFRSWPNEPHDVWNVDQTIQRFTASATANWTPLPWMTHRFTVGRDVTNEQNVEQLPFLTNDTLRFFWGPRWSDGYRYQNNREVVFDTWDYSGALEFGLSPSVASTTSFGVQYYKKTFEHLDVQGEGFPAPGLESVEAAANKTFQTQDFWDNRTLGVFGQQQFGWNDRLFVTAAARIDNNSAFGDDVDFVVYPKASVSWVLHEEPFFQERQPGWLSALRLRAAYGESGQQPDVGVALRTFAPVTGPGSSSAVTPDRVGNTDLEPERGREIELGLDAGFLDDRLALDFTYYRTVTEDAILERDVSPSLGFPGRRFVNAGQILNQGIEAVVRASVLERRSASWDLSLNLSTNSGEVQQLAGTDTTLVAGSLQHRIGYPAHSWFRERVVSAELGPDGRAINVMCDDGAGGSTPCFNANGAIVAPRVYLGRTTPSMEGSLTSSLRVFDRFQIHGLLDFKRGHKKWDNNLRARCQIFGTCMENLEPQNYDPKVVAQMQTSGTLVDFVIKDGSFVRLRELALGIELPERLTRYIGSSSATINFAMRNIHTWTDYTGLDPEVQFLGGSIAFGFEQDQIPHPRQFVTTINVNF